MELSGRRGALFIWSDSVGRNGIDVTGRGRGSGGDGVGRARGLYDSNGLGGVGEGGGRCGGIGKRVPCDSDVNGETVAGEGRGASMDEPCAVGNHQLRFLLAIHKHLHGLGREAAHAVARRWSAAL